MKIVAAWELGHGYGHVARLNAVSRAFRQFGHDVDFVGRDASLASAKSGVIYGTVMAAPRLATPLDMSDATSPAQLSRTGGFNNPHTLSRMLAAWLAVIVRLQPNLIVCDYAPVAMLAAYIAKVRSVSVGTSFFVSPSDSLPHLRPWSPISARAKANADSAVDDVIEEACVMVGRTSPGSYLELQRTSLPYWTTWALTDHLGARQNIKYYGPLASLEGGLLRPWPNRAGPKVLVYLPWEGTSAAALRSALSHLNWPVLWHWPGRDGRDGRDGNIALSGSPLDLTSLLAEADVFVSRGGHGAACHALCRGCPHLMLPDQLEASLLAYQAGRQGYALPLLPNSEPKVLLRGLLALTQSPELLSRIKRLSRPFTSYDGRSAANDLAKDILATC